MSFSLVFDFWWNNQNWGFLKEFNWDSITHTEGTFSFKILSQKLITQAFFLESGVYIYIFNFYWVEGESKFYVS